MVEVHNTRILKNFRLFFSIILVVFIFFDYSGRFYVGNKIKKIEKMVKNKYFPKLFVNIRNLHQIKSYENSQNFIKIGLVIL